MSIGPAAGIAASAAGAPVAQARGSEVERAQQSANTQQRKTDSLHAADDAAGIGKTSEDQESSDRDADGRRLWEFGPDGKPKQDEPAQPKPTRDPTGQSGTVLDLTG